MPTLCRGKFLPKEGSISTKLDFSRGEEEKSINGYAMCRNRKDKAEFIC
jgi:hypothetical protein